MEHIIQKVNLYTSQNTQSPSIAKTLLMMFKEKGGILFKQMSGKFDNLHI